MKIEGTENELKKLFKDKQSMFNGSFWESKSGKKMTKRTKDTILVVGLFVGLIVLVLFAVQMYFDTSDNYVTTYECSSQITSSILSAENITWQSQLISAIRPMMGFLLLCLGISWIVHGVGFRIIR